MDLDIEILHSKVMKYVTGGNFKPNCAAVCLDFMIRHGMANPDTGKLIIYYYCFQIFYTWNF